MSNQSFDEDDTLLEEPIVVPEVPSKVSLSTKLERRRRIEDLNEERRLREELHEF